MFPVIIIFVSVITFFIFLIPILPIYSHNFSYTYIPISPRSILLDGHIDKEEWKDAAIQNFTNSNNIKLNTFYLKYDISKNILDGAFFVPDTTSSTVKGKLDQIAFLFDTKHNANNTTIDSNDHVIIFGRDKGIEYYIGQKVNGEYSYKSIKNSSNVLQLDAISLN